MHFECPVDNAEVSTPAIVALATRDPNKYTNRDLLGSHMNVIRNVDDSYGRSFEKIAILKLSLKKSTFIYTILPFMS